MSFMYTLLFVGGLIQSPPLYTKSRSPHGLPCHNHTIRGKQHLICWTVDDHPFRTTPHMLRLLKQHKLKATFFVVGSMLRYHSIRPTKYNKRYVRWFKAIVAAGHTVGNHSVTHGHVCRMTTKKVRWELTETQRVTKLYGGQAPVHFRPPHGVWCRRLAREVKRLRLAKVMYHVSDYKSTAARMWRAIRWRMRKGKKHTIVLVHYNHWTLRRLLNRIKLNP